MRGRSMLIRLVPLWALACAGTSTGNPMDPGTQPAAGGSTDNTTVPQAEIKVLKSDATRESAPVLDTNSADRFGDDNRAFAFELYRKLTKANENLCLSPYSISMGLAMAFAGATGATKSEMGAVLHFGLPEPELHRAFNATSRALQGRQNERPTNASGDGFALNMAGQTWGPLGYPFLDSYLDVLAVNYDAALFTVDFTNATLARQTINRWVQQQTGERIKDLLPLGSIASDARLVLTNAVYFRASWQQAFDITKTAPGTFHAPDGDRTVSVMRQTFETGYAEGSNYQALSLPYLSGALRMTLILPAEGAFATITSNLNDAFFGALQGALNVRLANVAMPRFQFESARQLKQPLSTLGMSSAFGTGASFGALGASGEPLWLSEIHHQVFVTVDEQGTEAAPSTAQLPGTDSVKPGATLTLDRPFLFVIHDEPSGQILFLGQLADPG